MVIYNDTRGTVVATRAERAQTSAARRKGLLGRTEFPAGSGLSIEPCQGIHCFFMQFAIDVIFLDRRLRVKKVRSAVKPWRIALSLTAHSVLELPVGTVEAAGIQRGDQLRFEA